ncbi:extracellular solute-binding protein [Chloroflexi bacterium TSY]|nr:extracellular solute-binding protein [Chloroflexi bacterium TSY]
MKSKVMISLIITLILSACVPAPATQPSTNEDAADTTTGDEVTTITCLALGWNGVEDVIKVFEEENPDINVEPEMVPFNALFEQIQVRLGANSTDPDVLSVDVPLVAGYGLRGWLLPLEDVFTEEERQDWLDAALEAGSYEGNLLAAPVSTSTQLLFYNADLFEKAGLTSPGEDDRLTYAQIAELAPQLTFDEDGDGIMDIWGFNWEQANRIYQLQPMPESLGGDAIGPDGLTVDDVINSQPWIDAFTYYSNMFNELKAAPQDDTVGASDLFEAGKLAMYIAGPWNINRFVRADVDFAWGVSRHPYFESGDIVTPTGSWHIGVNKNTEQAEAATRFVRWLSTGKGAELWWRIGSGDFPAQKSVLALFATDEEFNEPPQSYLRVAADEATINPVPRPVTPGYLEYEQILQNTFSDIRNGADVEEALNLAVERIESEMVKYSR